MWKLLLVLSVSCACSLTTGVLEESFVRTSKATDGTTVQTMSDGKVIVTAFVDQKGELIDCNVLRDNSTAAKELFKEAVNAERNEKTEFKMVEFDVRKLGRICQKFRRDTLLKRPAELTVEDKKIRERISLDKAVDGTRWCTRQGRKPSFQNLGEKNILDQCCMNLQKCDTSVPGFTHSNEFFNHLPWPLPGCDCVNVFRECTRQEGTEEAVRFSQQLLQSLGQSCVRWEMKDECAEYSKWLDRCTRWEKQNTPVISKVSIQ
ncbi:uncharacterized protein LOC143238799 [Tachypleus tridentatus]|uniref:uncharacterized protein LOC143238799 n=1 Tax=Tachypleus tridentatus TaxID=6853 RepID=UPI003FD24AAE